MLLAGGRGNLLPYGPGLEDLTQQSAGGLETKSACLRFFLASLPPPLLTDEGGGEGVCFHANSTPIHSSKLQACILVEASAPGRKQPHLDQPSDAAGFATADSSSQVFFFNFVSCS